MKCRACGSEMKLTEQNGEHVGTRVFREVEVWACTLCEADVEVSKNWHNPLQVIGYDFSLLLTPAPDREVARLDFTERPGGHTASANIGASDLVEILGAFKALAATRHFKAAIE